MPKLTIDYTVSVGCRVTLAQKNAYEKLGGSKWLRGVLTENVKKPATKHRAKSKPTVTT